MCCDGTHIQGALERENTLSCEFIMRYKYRTDKPGSSVFIIFNITPGVNLINSVQTKDE